MVELKIGRKLNHIVLLDDADFPLIQKYRWKLMQSGASRTKYAAAYVVTGSAVLMHRLILGLTTSPPMVDHVNGNGLDNRRINLRLCSHAENMRNRQIHSNNKSGFKGVYLVPTRLSKPWRAEIRHNKQKFHVGQFATAEEAHAAYMAAAKRLHGEFARVRDGSTAVLHTSARAEVGRVEQETE